MRNRFYTQEKQKIGPISLILIIIILAIIIFFGAKEIILSKFKQIFMPSTTEIQALLKDTIINNPTIIMNAIRAAQEQEQLKIEQKADAFYINNKSKIEKDNISPISGNKEANINLVYFSDYNCKYCRNFNSLIKKILIENPSVKLIHKNVPILGEESNYAAKIALAVYSIDPNKFSSIDNYLSTNRANKEQVDNFITQLGINLEQFHKALNDPKLDEEIVQNVTFMREMNIGGTPAILVNGKLLKERNEQGLKELIQMQKEKN